MYGILKRRWRASLDKLSNIKARLEALEGTSTGPPNTFPIFGVGTPGGVSTPKPFEAPMSLEDIKDADLREVLRAIQTPAHDRKKPLTDPQHRYMYVQWYR